MDRTDRTLFGALIVAVVATVALSAPGPSSRVTSNAPLAAPIVRAEPAEPASEAGPATTAENPSEIAIASTN